VIHVAYYNGENSYIALLFFFFHTGTRFSDQTSIFSPVLMFLAETVINSLQVPSATHSLVLFAAFSILFCFDLSQQHLSLTHTQQQQQRRLMLPPSFSTTEKTNKKMTELKANYV